MSRHALFPRGMDDLSLDAVLAPSAISSVYQPIVDLESDVVIGYEALARGPAGSKYEQPAQLFAAAERAGRVSELDYACRVAAFAGARAAGMRDPWTLFVNVEPAAATAHARSSSSFGQSDHTPGAASAHQVVIELTERALTAHPAELFQMVAAMRRRGWGVALDDVGADPDSLALLPLVRPDVIKLDLSIVQQQPSAQVARIFSAVNAEAERAGSIVLAEGIETDEHRAIALSLGATLGQGWLLGMPEALPTTLPRLAGSAIALCSQPDGSRKTPYEILSAVRTPRSARKQLLIEISKNLERRALESGESTVILSTFQDSRFFSDATQLRYAELASHSALVAAMGAGMGPAPASGVRGTILGADDPLLGEWDIVVVGPHFAAVLVARDLGDHGPDANRRFEFVLSHDRDLTIRAANVLMSRMSTASSPAALVSPATAGSSVLAPVSHLSAKTRSHVPHRHPYVSRQP